MRFVRWFLSRSPHVSVAPTSTLRQGYGGFRPPARLASLLPVLALAVTGGACGDPGSAGSEAASSPSDPATPATWTLSDEPLLEIGVVEGEDAYQFHDVRDALVLGDGRFVVADQGSRELRFFDAEGGFLFATGEAGEGPGEWRLLDELRLLAPDTLLVVDPWLDRMGLVSPDDGAYLGTLDDERARDIVWPRSFHAGLMIEAPLDTGELGLLEPVLGQLDPLSTQRPAVVVADRQGRVWVHSAPSAPRPTVRVFDLAGTLRARLELPRRFHLMELTRDRVLGVQRDELDVEFVHVYGLARDDAWTGESLARVVRASEPGPLPDLFVDADPPEEIIATLKAMASHQEIHYASHMRYSDDLEALSEQRPLVLPDAIEVDILEAGTSGWMARMMDPASGGGCVISYGAFRAAQNLDPGRVSCWRAPGRDEPGG